MTRTSEFVAPGHPDRVADGVVSYLLDRYIERDPRCRVGLECQIKDNHVTLGGEVTSAYNMGDDELKRHVRDAICAIGYTPEYARRWGAGNCIDPDALDVVAHIGQQSPDIAQGVDADGWGDQGIFWGMATFEETGFMPADHHVARQLGMWLYEDALNGSLPIGIDIKTQVTVVDGVLKRVIVAAPVKSEEDRLALRAEVAKWLWEGCHEVAEGDLIVNGTGVYVRHASAGDCGTTGRKLAVDFYGGNCFIGGGCPWGKDPTKADVTLNVYARKLALEYKRKSGRDTVYCALDCCIGRKEVGVVYYDEHMNEVASGIVNRPAREIIAELGLNRPVFAFKCRNGLFAEPSPEGV